MKRPENGNIIKHGHHAYRILDFREPLDGTYAYEIIAERLTGKNKGEHYGIRAKSEFAYFRVIGEHFEVCNTCGELPPCSGIRAERAVQASVEAMKVPDGYCPACKEPITHRQRKFVFPGPNLLNPFGADGVQFHQRRQCYHGARRYEEKWVQADPSRPRSLLTLSCEGRVTVHADGTGECHGRNDGRDCPHILAEHRSMEACYTMDHGCGKECPREGHPGIRLRRDLLPDGSIGGLL